MALITQKTISEFYANKTMAVIGASRDKKKFGGTLFSELLKRGYKAVPVNPHGGEIQGQTAYKSIKEVPGDITVAITVVPPAELEKVVLEAAQAGIQTLWMHDHVMKGVSNPKAIYLCEEKGMTCITGFCPFMFLPKTGFPHNVHKMIMKIFGALPK